MEVEAFIALGKTPYDLYGRHDRMPAPTATHPQTEERIRVLQRRAELRQPLKHPKDETRPPSRPPLVEPCDDDDDTLVTQRQMAKLLGISKAWLRFRIDNCHGMFPDAAEPHDGWRRREKAWFYREVRPWLEDLFGVTLPAKYVGVAS
jgi:hypothetical protein